MRRMIFSVYDRASGLFGTPVLQVNANVMFRIIADEVKRGGADNMLAQHSKDFCVYHLGTFNDEDGSFQLDKPMLIFEVAKMVEDVSRVPDLANSSAATVAELRSALKLDS